MAVQSFLFVFLMRKFNLFTIQKQLRRIFFDFFIKVCNFIFSKVIKNCVQEKF